MPSGLALTIYLIAAFVAGILGTIIARAKRRDSGFWMVACFLIPPLLVVLLLLPKRPFVAVHQSQSEDPDNLDNF